MASTASHHDVAAKPLHCRIARPVRDLAVASIDPCRAVGGETFEDIDCYGVVLHDEKWQQADVASRP